MPPPGARCSHQCRPLLVASMLNRDRLEAALSSNPLHPEVFEQCAQDLLTELYPGLSPIAGGSDGGRDADIEAGDKTPVRLLVTAARSYKGVRDNLLRGLASMTLHDVPHDRLV